MAQWIIDPDHSCAAFSIRHMMIANVHGQFNRLAGVIQFDQPYLSRSIVEVTIEAAGIYTGIPKRDDHLRSVDFFDAASYPLIVFKSAKVQQLDKSRCRINGELTMRGVTRPVSFEAEFSGPVKSPFGGEVSMGFTAKTRLNREDYGIMWNEVMDAGGIMVGKEVDIILNVEADLSE